MAILEKIRKRSLILILVIGLALFAFIISDIFNSGGFNAGKNDLGEVNGTPVSRESFVQKVEAASRRFGPNATTIQLADQVWEQEVRNIILSNQFDKLGISIEKDQIINVVKQNPQLAQSPEFLNEAGVFDDGKFIAFIADLQQNNPLGFEQWKQQEEALIQASKEQTYFNLVKAAIAAGAKDGETAYRQENEKIDFKYVRIPYTSIADSTITVSNSEIEAYIKKNSKEFKTEASRSIRYVLFEEKPSTEDEEAVKNSISALLNNSVVYNETTKTNDTVAGFKTTTDVGAFVNTNSDIKIDTTYVTKNMLSPGVADTIFKLNVGEVYGPYLDNGYYKLTRMMGRKSGGAVKASHILIAYEGAQAPAREPRTKEEALAKANELLGQAKENPDSFGILAIQNSEDQGSATRGGTYDNIPEGQMVKPFNDFIFQNPVGTIGVVETDFGYHVIKVDDKYDAVQLATVAQQLEPSEKTTGDVYNVATKFEMAVNDKDFAEVAKTSNYEVRPVERLKAMDEQIFGLGNQRQIVQWAFNDAKVGDVKRFNVPGGYAIAQLTKIAKDGLAKPEDVTGIVTPILRKQKKAAMIMEKNKGKSLQQLANDNKTQVQTASAITASNPALEGIGRELKVVGAAMALKPGSTSALIEGESGVYMIEAVSKTEAPKQESYTANLATLRSQSRNRVQSAVYQALKEASEIEDNRAIAF